MIAGRGIAIPLPVFLILETICFSVIPGLTRLAIALSKRARDLKYQKETGSRVKPGMTDIRLNDNNKAKTLRSGGF